MFRAALTSRSTTRPQLGQRWVRSESGLLTHVPQVEQPCEVPPGGTLTTWTPASSALYPSSLRNSAQPWSRMSLARIHELTLEAEDPLPRLNRNPRRVGDSTLDRHS